MIVRGTTPHHSFFIPELGENVTIGYVTYSQLDEIKVEKEFTGEDLIPANCDEEEGYKLIVNLTQEDTLSFHFLHVPSKDSIEIQLRIYTESGESYVSNIIHELPGKVLRGGVIGE